MRRTVYALHKDGSFFAVSMVIEAFTVRTLPLGLLAFFAHAHVS